MKTLLTFTLGMALLSSTHSIYPAVNPEAVLGVDLDSIAQEYQPPSRGRSGNGIGGGTRFDGRSPSSLIS